MTPPGQARASRLRVPPGAILCSFPDTVVYRPEIPSDLAAAARLHCTPPYPSLTEAAVAVRERGRREGEKLAQRLVSRTRLVKGLEFDHTIVFDVPQLDLRNLVALTRGASSVTVVES